MLFVYRSCSCCVANPHNAKELEGEEDCQSDQKFEDDIDMTPQDAGLVLMLYQGLF
jgi:hypothetical protein